MNDENLPPASYDVDPPRAPVDRSPRSFNAPPGYFPPGYAPPGYAPPAPDSDAQWPGYPPPGPWGPRCGLATAALVCGLIGFIIPLLGIVALVMGIVAVRRILRQPADFGGAGRALTGVVTGSMGTVLTLMLTAFVIIGAAMASHDASRSELVKRTLTTGNLAAVGTGLQAFAEAHHGQMPPSLETLADEELVTTHALRAPLAPDHSLNTCDFRYVADLDPARDPGDWIVAYGDLAWTQGQGASVLRLNGTTEYLHEPQFSTELQRCQREFKRTRGRPPQIVQPR